MSPTRSLVELLAVSAARRPDHVAVEDLPDGRISYGALEALSNRVRDRLRRIGVSRGDRVGVCLRKSIDAYAAMLGAMKAGAAYVPIDVSAPAWRTAFIVEDCSLTALFIDAGIAGAWRDASRSPPPTTFVLAQGTGGRELSAALDRADSDDPAPRTQDASLGGDDLAYILYTSGSTGTPKGVMLTHTCAMSFVDWCAETFEFRDDDRFGSHAPFHFDLSIFDLYVSLKHGATVVLIDADSGREPMGLAALIANRRLTIWYSTPTVLTLLAEFGRMERHDFSALRYIFFAGEVFPVKHLREIKARLPHADFFNLYGPTETNVCTWHAVPRVIEPDRTEPYPIGRTCAPFTTRVIDEPGTDVERGRPGELLVHGPGVMQGYWNRPDLSGAAFSTDPEGRTWYHTGDVVTEQEDGVYILHGRRDRMVKRRGYRIELGEIEAGIYRHPAVQEAAVVAVRNQDGLRIKLFIALADGHPRSEIAMRQFCATALPAYMIPDAFEFRDRLPRTSTDKIDYQRLSGDA